MHIDRFLTTTLSKTKQFPYFFLKFRLLHFALFDRFKYLFEFRIIIYLITFSDGITQAFSGCMDISGCLGNVGMSEKFAGGFDVGFAQNLRAEVMPQIVGDETAVRKSAVRNF